ncbi:glycosyltransferase [Alkalimonas sp. NCh-2]|uniref:glycosyltransferase n=1 Tax=Alkalimonas sp. NCh-2 TaxID=3144846 RepID=UPI0031F5F6D6
MNILFVISGLKMGGAEVQVCALASELHKQGNKVAIVSMIDEIEVRPESNDIQVITLGLKGMASIFNGVIRFRKVVKDFNPDVVHSHLFHAIIFSRLYKKVFSLRRLVCTAHNTYDGGFSRVALYRVTDSFNDYFTNVSQEAVDSFISNRATKPGRIKLVYNGIDIKKFRPDITFRHTVRSEFNIPDKAKLVLAVGRLHVQKNFTLLLDVISSIKEHQIFLLIVGAGPLLAQLREKAIELDIEKNVIFTGVRSDVPHLMSASDLFVLSSSWEGFGLVVAEAMASGTLAVATDCGGVKEVLGDCGYLVPPADSCSLRDAIVRALSISESERTHLVNMGRKRVCNLFSIDKAVETWLSIYNECE